MISDGKMVWTKIVGFEKIYTFIVDNFFINIHLCSRNCVLRLMIINFIFFGISQMTLDGKTIKSKVVDLDEI
jgi:hypothetical protein